MSADYIPQNAGNLPITTVCIKELKIAKKKSICFFYALGSTTCSEDDEPNQVIGDRIAEQRADKAIEWLSDSRYELARYDFKRKYMHLKGIKDERISVLTLDELNDTERSLLDLNKPFEIVEAPNEDLEKKCGINVQVEKDE